MVNWLKRYYINYKARKLFNIKKMKNHFHAVSSYKCKISYPESRNHFIGYGRCRFNLTKDESMAEPVETETVTDDSWMSDYDTAMSDNWTSPETTMPSWRSNNTTVPWWSGEDCGGWSVSGCGNGSSVSSKYSCGKESYY